MKRSTIAVLSALAVAAAAPASADSLMSGYFRTQGVAELLTADGQTKDQSPDTIAETRIRARWQNNLNEYVSVVWFGEMDAVWGEGVTKAGAKNNQVTTAGTPAPTTDTQLGGGGRQGADGVNLETKNALLDVKVPGTPVSARLGLQSFTDQTLSGLVMNDDLAGARVDVKTNPVNVTVGWFKVSEGSVTNAHLRRSEDDSDLYAVQVALEPVKGFRLVPEMYYALDQKTPAQGDSRKEYYLGLGAAWTGPVTVNGFVVYDGGKQENRGTAKDVDISAWAASAKVIADVAGAKLGLRGIYFSKDDSATKDHSFGPPNGSNGGLETFDEILQVFLYDPYALNGGGGRRALTDAAYAGYGLLGAVASASYTPPGLKALSLKAAVAYFEALDDRRDDSAAAADNREGKSLGTEFAAVMSYKVAERVDVILRGAYALLGDFYDKKAANSEDPENLYKVALTVNVPY